MTTAYRPQVATTLYVSEIFASLQGEGPHQGQPAMFLRLMGCNLHCAWCDTAYTWDHTRHDLRAEAKPLAPAAVYAALQHLNRPILVLTGGEPLLQTKALAPLIHQIAREQSWQVEVETNGTLPPPSSWLFHIKQWNVSPKLAHSGNDDAKALVVPTLRIWASLHNAVFKFVCQSPADVDRVVQVARSLGLPPARIWIQPEGTTLPILLHRLRILTPAALTHGFNVSMRLHSFVWGDARGR